MMHFIRFIFLLVLSLNFVWHCGYVSAEVIAGEAIPFEVTRDGLQDKMEKLEAKPGVDPESKAREMNWYLLSDENIGDQKWFEFFVNSYQQTLQTAPELLKDWELEKLSPESGGHFDNERHYSEKELELLIVNSKGKLRTVNEQISKLESGLNKYIQRPQQIREETLLAKQRLKQAKKEINTARPATENKYEYKAHQVYLHTLIGALSAELKKLELEVLTTPLHIQLNKRSLEALVEEKNQLQSIVEQQEQLLETQQLANATSLEQSLLKTERESAQKHTVIKKIIQDNIQWSRDLQAIVLAINQYEHETDKIEDFKLAVEDDATNAENKIRLAGLNPILGRVLREQRNNLSAMKQQIQSLVNISDETGQISLALYKVEQRYKQLQNIQQELELQIQQVHLSLDIEQLSRADIEQISQEIQQLLYEQKNLLSELDNTYYEDLRVLGDYQFAQEQLLIIIDQYASYLDERLLWVPSSLPVDLDYPREIYTSIRWFAAPAHWQQLFQELVNTAKEKQYISFFILFMLLALINLRPSIKLKTSIINDQVSRAYTDKSIYTFQVFLFNLILVIPIPMMLFYISWLLRSLAYQEEFSRAVGIGLYHAAISLLILRFLYKYLIPKGIAELHFKWQESTVSLLRRQITWLQFLIVPSIFIIYTTSSISIIEHSDTLGRLGLIAFMLVLFSFFMRLFDPKNGILNKYFIANKSHWWVKLRYFWYIIIISAPLIIMGFAIMGYLISAVELQQKIIVTLRVIFIAIIVYNLIVRWLTLTNRELALINLRNKRKAHELNAQQADSLSEDAETPIPCEEEILDIPKINEQTVKMVNALIGTILLISCWLIWKNIFPAFSFIDNIVLWQYVTTINNEQIIQAITLTNLFLAGFYTFIIIIAVFNFPGVMEVLVFRNLDIESGTRYAINQLAKYTLTGIGFILVASELGGRWGQVQWLVAALTVGLGFGLQEIFANMVSGIIILFERPIRVGDTVTVDNITGRVTRIQMRATTIMDWDQKELIVPNKTFITNQLVNWTLTDPVTRLVIPIGISYGSDIDLAYRTISETVCTTPLVLKEPKPSIYFIGFGDSSLDFTIRVYVNELANRLPVTHDLHVRLTEALRKEGIEIPFPQRDVNVRSGFAEFSDNKI
ncbi:MAG: mechanosensitive ion channel protein MscS [Gammaproteobacteria bacterium]|nr:MAG: mechanosensitive ion channel protein MscS [Gammaproteobacteria bacterium]